MKLKSYVYSTAPSIYGEMSSLAQKHNAVNMTQGAPDFETPSWLIEYLNYYSTSGYNKYSPIPGTIELRKACSYKIYDNYNVKYNPENEIMISCGASEAIFSAVMAFIRSGDEVIFFDPAFDIFSNSVQNVQGVSKRLKLKNGRIDLAQLEETITPKTKMIILNSPHNPVGSIISKDEYLHIAQIIRNKNILLVCDEVYEHMHCSKSFTSAMQIESLRKNLIVIQSLGKTYNITGWRIGVCIGPEEILLHLNAVRQFLAYSAPTPMQLALAEGIMNHPEYYRNISKLYQKQHHTLISILKNSRFKIFPWAGSPFQLLGYEGITNKNDHDFAKELIIKYGIGLVPISSLYETPKHGYLRLCFAKYDKELIKGAKLLCKI